MTTIIYGIKNCDTIRKALKWLESANIPHQFHDYRKDGIDKAMLLECLSTLKVENLLNKRGTTFRNLPEEIKNTLTQETSIELMLNNPAIIKRPLLKHNNQYHIGFSIEQYQALFSKES